MIVKLAMIVTNSVFGEYWITVVYVNIVCVVQVETLRLLKLIEQKQCQVSSHQVKLNFDKTV
jgi:uncharacterized membrane protein (Fun14 family)